jgi:TatD DNase family protein
MIRYFDAHNHLQDDWLAPYLGEVISSLEEIGVRRAVVNGTLESDWEAVASLAHRHPWVIPSYGLHPWYIARRTPQWRERLTACLDSGTCGVGEIGLDRWLEGLDFEDQKSVFTDQLALAAERNLPVSIHCLKAWGPLLEILQNRLLPARGFLLHSYGGSLEMVPEFAKLGGYFSFSGYFLAEKNTVKREVFRQMPVDRLLVETDAPAMHLPAGRIRYPLPDSPEGKQVNHPSNIGAVYEGLSEIRGLPVEKLAFQIEVNFERLFSMGSGDRQTGARSAA